ncbi:eCIS core domain-containing protein [Cyclobacterium marinum]|uniref:eCIS core domain-containing protein n=1 Tax=Cyclobacterium marinum TaxID=104 RepID=UPI0011EC0C22|nr:DUF4157 domain-containing protein [Cyclobacterium marinum]MBI0398292.1 DUF4157 domain-containing protein [Cyclobacterium marinum]
MKRHGFRKSSVGLINPTFQSKEGNGFFRRQGDRKEALIPNVANEHFFDPILQSATEEKESAEAVQKKGEDENKVNKKENTKEEIKKQEVSEEDSVQKVEEEEAVQPKTKEEEGLQKVAEEEQVSASSEEEEAVQQMSEEEAAVQSKTEEEGALQAKNDEEGIQAKEEESKVINTRQSQADSIESTLYQEKGKGMGMAPDIKQKMENSFDSDFSKVRIHTGKKAQMMCEKIQAKAFTHGFDLFFGQGQYRPDTKAGKHLLAHELTHTIQQKGKVKKAIQSKLNDGHDFHPTSRFSANEMLEDIFDNNAVLKISSSGTAVMLLQHALIGLDYRLPTFGADGSFGGETSRAVKAFQADMGLTVDGIVGRNTIRYLDRLDRGVEVAVPELPITIDTKINLNNVIAQAGAIPSTSLSPVDMGRVFPENIEVRLKLVDDGLMWHPIIIGLTGHYSVQTRLLPGMKEVTGPGGNTTEENYCAQIKDLNSMALSKVDWFMEDVVLAHERFHASKIRSALISPLVIKPLEKSITDLAFQKSSLAFSEQIAEVMLRLDKRFEEAVFEAEIAWTDQFISLIKNDHGDPKGTGPAYREGKKIAMPMINKIRKHAKANNWSSCPHGMT